VSRLLTSEPYAQRDDQTLLDELNELTAHHRAGCQPFARIWPDPAPAGSLEELPFVHVGLFKQMDLATSAADLKHERTLGSSGTSGAVSRVPLDSKSLELQARSTQSILMHHLGPGRRPLIVIDSVASLRQRGQVSARTAAAMSLRPLSSRIAFLLDDSNDPASARWEVLEEALDSAATVLVFGHSWILWQVWNEPGPPQSVREALMGHRLQFVHSGGWKKLEAARVDRRVFDDRLLEGLGKDSMVLDFYGLAEQVGIIFPLCAAGWRHPPRWAAAIVRDSWTLESSIGRSGQLQLLNSLAWGAPYHSVLTEDLATLDRGPCACGLIGERFRLEGRVPKSELRGCANQS